MRRGDAGGIIGTGLEDSFSVERMVGLEKFEGRGCRQYADSRDWRAVSKRDIGARAGLRTGQEPGREWVILGETFGFDHVWACATYARDLQPACTHY